MGSVTVTITTPGCTCCTPCVLGTLSCRTRGGTATLCGFSELTSPTTPPRKYRKCTNDQSTTITCSGACGGSGSFTCTDSPNPTYPQYNKDTCGFTGGVRLQCTDGFGYDTDCYDRFSPGCNIRFTTTQTSITPFLTSGDACCGGTGCGNGLATSVSGSITISDEDTEADALARLMAGSGGTWSSWSAGSSTTCLAQYQQRTTGFSFQYQEAQWRITASGLTPGKTYDTPIQYWRRTYGSGSYTLYSSVTASGAADGSGNLDIEGDVPNAIGYETYAAQGTCP